MDFFLDVWKRIRLMISFFNFMQDLLEDISQGIKQLTKSFGKGTIGLPYSETLMPMLENVILSRSVPKK